MAVHQPRVQAHWEGHLPQEIAVLGRGLGTTVLSTPFFLPSLGLGMEASPVIQVLTFPWLCSAGSPDIWCLPLVQGPETLRGRHL